MMTENEITFSNFILFVEFIPEEDPAVLFHVFTKPVLKAQFNFRQFFFVCVCVILEKDSTLFP